MANFVALEEDSYKVIFAKVREDGSLLIQARYYDPVKGGIVSMDEVELLQEGVKKLEALLVHDAQLRIGADEAGHDCPLCYGTGYKRISPTILAECKHNVAGQS